MIALGSVINGKYQLTRLLGDGGMGSVYEARHSVLGTRVAIKVLHPELGRRTGLVERFLQEARVAAQIRSPHVVQVTDVDRTPEGHAFIVMELLEGEPLSAVLDRVRKLPVPTACEYTLQILQALEAAHSLGVIHRDLKPENVFVTFAAGRPVLKLIDFGIAKARRTDPQQRNLTVAGVVMGTAEYMAPEQARNAGEVDARADLYAVGVMLDEMLSGSRPAGGEDARVIALKVERGEIVPLVQVAPDVPREIAGLVHRAMAPRPALRFATATEMRLALEKASAGRRASVAPASVAPASMAPGSELTATGTLKNVSAQQVLSPPSRPATAPLPSASPSGPTTDIEAPVHTERAPPMGTAMTPPTPAYSGVAGVAIPPPQDTGGRRGGGGRLAALIALPFVIGLGVVLVLVATGTWSPGSDSVKPVSTGSPGSDGFEAGVGGSSGSSGGGPVSPPTVATVPTDPGIPTLAPNGRLPPNTVVPRTGPSTHPTSPHARDAAAPSATATPESPEGPPPFVLPSTLPPFPPLPEGFPTVFPGWPGAPPPPPPPPPPGAPPPGAPPHAPAASSSSGSI